jgi:hypothetical protein
LTWTQLFFHKKGFTKYLMDFQQSLNEKLFYTVNIDAIFVRL